MKTLGFILKEAPPAFSSIILRVASSQPSFQPPAGTGGVLRFVAYQWGRLPKTIENASGDSGEMAAESVRRARPA